MKAVIPGLVASIAQAEYINAVDKQNIETQLLLFLIRYAMAPRHYLLSKSLAHKDCFDLVLVPVLEAFCLKPSRSIQVTVCQTKTSLNQDIGTCLQSLS